jgi:hypothetical protein
MFEEYFLGKVKNFHIEERNPTYFEIFHKLNEHNNCVSYNVEEDVFNRKYRDVIEIDMTKYNVYLNNDLLVVEGRKIILLPICKLKYTRVEIESKNIEGEISPPIMYKSYTLNNELHKDIIKFEESNY